MNSQSLISTSVEVINKQTIRQTNIQTNDTKHSFVTCKVYVLVLSSRNITTYSAYYTFNSQVRPSITMAAKYVSSSWIKTVQTGSKSIMIAYVDKTSLWTRPTDFPCAKVKEEFVRMVEDNIHTLDPNTTKVAMKYTP